MSKAITEPPKPEDRPILSNMTATGQEAPPSLVREDDLYVPRALGIYALGLTAVLLIRGKQFGAQVALAARAESRSAEQIQARIERN